MTIYRLEWQTWNGRAVSDFALPRTLGHYATFAAAALARDKRIAAVREHITTGAPDDWTDARDYAIEAIEVEA